MDLSLQTKLLRFLQTSTIQPVGAARPIPVDVRIVCATNRDPAEEVRAGPLPRGPLLPAARGADPHAAAPGPARGHHGHRPGEPAAFAAEEGKTFTGFDPEVAAILASRPWPGNVRQLLNVIRNIVVLHDGPLVSAAMLPVEIALGRARPASRPPVAPLPAPRSVPGPTTRDRVALLVGTPMADVERELIEATIAHCDGSIPRAAKMLALSPSTIYRKLEGWSGGAAALGHLSCRGRRRRAGPRPRALPRRRTGAHSRPGKPGGPSWISSKPRSAPARNAYAPYSGFKVGAAIRCPDGSVFAGCNVENVAYPQGTCAEAGAIAAMVAAGRTEIAEVLVVADGAELVTPCGGCRQKLAEFARPEAPVVLADLRASARAAPSATCCPAPSRPRIWRGRCHERARHRRPGAGLPRPHQPRRSLRRRRDHRAVPPGR